MSKNCYWFQHETICLDKKILPRDLQLFRKLDMYQNYLNSQRTDQKTSKDAHKITSFANKRIDKINNKLHGLSPPGGLVSPSGGFASLLCDQGLHLCSVGI